MMDAASAAKPDQESGDRRQDRSYTAGHRRVERTSLPGPIAAGNPQSVRVRRKHSPASVTTRPLRDPRPPHPISPARRSIVHASYATANTARNYRLVLSLPRHPPATFAEAPLAAAQCFCARKQSHPADMILGYQTQPPSISDGLRVEELARYVHLRSKR